jgi:hypothetical protein
LRGLRERHDGDGVGRWPVILDRKSRRLARSKRCTLFRHPGRPSACLPSLDSPAGRRSHRRPEGEGRERRRRLDLPRVAEHRRLPAPSSGRRPKEAPPPPSTLAAASSPPPGSSRESSTPSPRHRLEWFRGCFAVRGTINSCLPQIPKLGLGQPYLDLAQYFCAISTTRMGPNARHFFLFAKPAWLRRMCESRRRHVNVHPSVYYLL